MLKIYFVPRNADGTHTPSQERKHGTAQYGYDTVEKAFRHTPPGGYVEKRYNDGWDDWPGGIAARRPESPTIQPDAQGDTK